MTQQDSIGPRGGPLPGPAADPALHPSLRRQLRRAGLRVDQLPADQDQWADLLHRIDHAYRALGDDIYLLQRSLALVSAEMSELAEQVRSSAAAELGEADRRIRRLALAVEASVDAIVLTDPQAAIEYVNPAFSAVTGWDREEVIGQNPRILSSGLTDPAVYRHMWQTLGRGQLWTGRLRNRRKPNPDDPRGGQAYWALVTILPYFDTDGRTLLGYVAIQRDITDFVARESRQRLSVQAARLRADVAAQLHTAAPLQERLSAVARTTVESLRAITGAQWSALVQVTTPQVIIATAGPDLPAGFAESLEYRLGCSLAEVREARLVLPAAVPGPQSAPGGGDPVPEASPALAVPEIPREPVVIVAPSPPGAQVRAQILAHTQADVHPDPLIVESLALAAELAALAGAADRARRDLERARDEAEAATRAKAQFLATMSHEIRTPMNGVIGMLNLLAESPMAPGQREQLNLARTSAESLLTIINDILDFSKIEAGKVRLECVPFDVWALTEQVTALFRGQAHGRDVQVGAVFAPGLPRQVMGDPTRVRQVLSNIVGNAVKFTAHGHVSVRLRLGDDPAPSRDESGEPTCWLVFEVSDTGIGMDAPTVASLFHPFSQAEASTTRRFGGTGLGLAISRELVELMGGNISVSSSLGAGTNFAVTLPFQLAKPQAPGAPAPVPTPRASRPITGKVLLVEDNLINQKVARSMLAKLGVTVEVAGDGEQALARLAAEEFGLVLMDCQMPVLDGFAATRAYRSQEPEGKHLPIIALTANALVGAQDECQQAGMDGYLSKPYSKDDLATVLDRWLAG